MAKVRVTLEEKEVTKLKKLTKAIAEGQDSNSLDGIEVSIDTGTGEFRYGEYTRTFDICIATIYGGEIVYNYLIDKYFK